MEYREELPPGCPPESAREITEATIRYRLLRNPSAEEADFDSYARQRGAPNPRLRRTPCEQHGISLTTSLPAARNLLDSHYNRDQRWQAVGMLSSYGSLCLKWLPGWRMLAPTPPAHTGFPVAHWQGFRWNTPAEGIGR